MNQINRRSLLTLFALLMLGVSIAAPALTKADGVVIVDPPPCEADACEPTLIGDQLEVKTHRVDVSIANQIATTKIDQVFHSTLR